MIMNLFQPIFELLGISEFLLSPSALIAAMSNLPNWYDILSPQILVSWLIYFMFAYGTIFVLLVIPFRFFKKLIRVPKRKG